MSVPAFGAPLGTSPDDLGSFYRLPLDPCLDEFLRDRSDLRRLLQEARPYLRRYFGDAELILRLDSDDYGWQTLFVDALWPGEAHDATAALDRFEDAWWIANSRAAEGCLTFTYRLV